MKIKLISIGKTDNKNLQILINDYTKRLNHYVKFSFDTIPCKKPLVFWYANSHVNSASSGIQTWPS